VPHGRKLAVIGLGYVGLPVAVAFGRQGARVIGFDIDAGRISELKTGRDRTCEVEPDDLARSNVVFTSDPAELSSADFFIVTVPTPIDKARRPDLTALLRASATVGKGLKKGDIVVYESTVYPGATEEDCVPVLEQVSGLLAGRDFTVGIAAGLHKAPSIKVAEAAKVIENAQRDLNIAFMNELSAIFQELGIDTGDVLAAAGTKWNFLNFTPGLVGGHCIGVDPYYLTYRAQKAGYHPDVILAGRRINDSIGVRVARECLRRLLKAGAPAPRVTVLGLIFKENVVDLRNSQGFDIVRELQSFGVSVQVNDPLADGAAALKEYGLTLQKEPEPADAVVLAVAHDAYRKSGWPLITRLLKNGGGLVMDVKGALDPRDKPAGIEVWRL